MRGKRGMFFQLLFQKFGNGWSIFPGIFLTLEKQAAKAALSIYPPTYSLHGEQREESRALH